MQQREALVLADRYELGDLLGQGGMAHVYRAIDRTLDRAVAVKVLAPPYDRDRGYVERFRREALAAARLNHPNIVTVFDSGEDDRHPFIVMELVEGETLGARLRRRGPLAPSEVVGVGSSVAAALADAHEHGVVHRDVKPGNIMLTDDDRVKVLDFGIARASGAEAVTRTGLVMGSASYLSPEQAQGASGDERTDIYALGCVLYQMVTGRPPFVGDDPVAALYQHVNEPVVPPSSLRAVPPELEAVILRCLEKEPSDRFATARELETALVVASLEGPTATFADVTAAPTGRLASRGGRPESLARAGTRTATHDRGRWVLAAVVGAVAFALVVAVVAFADPFGGNGKASTRTASATSDAVARALDRADPAPSVVSDPEVAAAYRAVIVALASAHAAGDADGAASDELTRLAEDAVSRWRASDAPGIDRAVGAFASTMAHAQDDGKIAPTAVGALDDAMDRLVVAMAAGLPAGASGPANPPPAPSPKPHPDHGHGNGPPDHANGNADANDEGD